MPRRSVTCSFFEPCIYREIWRSRTFFISQWAERTITKPDPRMSTKNILLYAERVYIQSRSWKSEHYFITLQCSFLSLLIMRFFRPINCSLIVPLNWINPLLCFRWFVIFLLSFEVSPLNTSLRFNYSLRIVWLYSITTLTKLNSTNVSPFCFLQFYLHR